MANNREKSCVNRTIAKKERRRERKPDAESAAANMSATTIYSIVQDLKLSNKKGPKPDFV